ncbi:unnamed protein product [Leuciscus chuanchicus]
MFLQGSDEYAYDGQTLTFDLSMHWKPLVLDHDIIWDRESVSSLERKCVETLTRFTELQREGKIIMESRPDVHTLVKASGSSVTSLLVCLATDFYPKHVQMEIRHDQTPVPDDQLNSEGIRPNADGSFQLKKSLEILPSERSQYQCVVKHQTLTEPFSVTGVNVRMRVVLLIGFIVALVVLVIIVLVFYLLRKCVKRRKFNLKHQNESLQLPVSPQLPLSQPPLELWEEMSESELCAAALNTDPEEENPTDPSVEEVHSEEVHDTQSLCETEVTPEAARGVMGSKNFSLPNFAMEREDTDQNTITQNALLLPLPRRCRSKDISLPNLTQDRKDSDDSDRLDLRLKSSSSLYISKHHWCKAVLMGTKNSGTERGEVTAATWQYYEDMHEVLGARPSLDPPVVVASFYEDPTTILMPAPLQLAVQNPLPLPWQAPQLPHPPKKYIKNNPILDFLTEESKKEQRRHEES